MYKIKFLKSVSTTKAGKITTESIANIYGDGKELVNISQNWKAMGFLRVESIEVLKSLDRKNPTKLKKSEVVEMFYPTKTVTDEEKEIKNELLSDQNIEKDNNPPKEKDEESERQKLWNRAKDLVAKGKLDKMPPKNIGEEKLQLLIDNAKIDD